MPRPRSRNPRYGQTGTILNEKTTKSDFRELKPLPRSKERYAQGQALRKQMARRAHAQWKPASNRKSPLDLLAASMQGRLSSLVKVKYDRMSASPFGFFRGAVPVMAADLATLPRAGIVNQICGDAHVLNLCAFAAPDGRLVFDINDFDETTRAPFEWDVKRLAASLVLAGREAGIRNRACEEAVLAFIASYRTLMHALADMPLIQLVHYQVHRLGKVRPVSQALRRAQTATPQVTLDKLTVAAKKKTSGGTRSTPTYHRQFKHQPPLLERLSDEHARTVLASLPEYAESLLPERRHFLAQLRPIDVGFKVVGTGSVGLRDYIIYFQGNSAADPLFLQIKEEIVSAYTQYFPDKKAAHQGGQRVAEGQRAMQFMSDPFLGWTTIEKRHYLVRQLNDHKASISLDTLAGVGLNEYAQLCGELLARGHARSGDAQMLSGYVGYSDTFDEAIAEFAVAYADQTEKDWETLVASRKSSSNAASRSVKKVGVKSKKTKSKRKAA
jgi:uncharacterized protein (DUF2252 family)